MKKGVTMVLPEDIPRRPRAGPGKLEKELRLFFALYTDWIHADRMAPIPERGTPVGELQRLIAPGAQESAFRRMLDRYLLELERCGAILWARVGRNGYCTARFGEPGIPAKSETVPGSIHLDRLARATRLTREFLDREPPTGYDFEFYEQRFYTHAFFNSRGEAEKWYYDHFYMDESQRRTMQRDMRAAWQVIRKMRTEE